MATDFNQVSQDLARDMELLRNSVQSSSMSLDQLGAVGKSASNGMKRFEQAISTGSAFFDSVYKGSSALETVAATADSVNDVFTELVKGIPIVGGALGALAKKIFGIATETIRDVDRIFKGYSELSKIGATGARGLEQFYEQASRMGYGIEQINEFTSLVQRNSEMLSMFGAGVLDGLEKISKASEEFTKSGLRGELLSMGMNLESINSGIIRYARTMTITGQQAVNRELSLNAGAKEYILQMDRLAKLTGKSADAQQAEIEAMLQDERLLVAELRSKEEEKRLREEAARLNDDNLKAKADAIAQEREQRRAFLLLLPAEMRSALGSMIEGFATDKQSGTLLQIIPETVALLQAGNRDIKTLAATAVPELERYFSKEGVGNLLGTLNTLAENTGTRISALNEMLMRMRTVMADGVIPTITKDQTVTSQATTAIGALNDATIILKQNFQEFTTDIMKPMIEAMGKLRGQIESLPPYPFRQQRPAGMVPSGETQVPTGPASPEELTPPASPEEQTPPAAPRPPTRPPSGPPPATRPSTTPAGPSGAPPTATPGTGPSSTGQSGAASGPRTYTPEEIRKLLVFFPGTFGSGSEENFNRLDAGFKAKVLKAAELFKQATGGAQLGITSAFRSFEQQKAIFDNARPPRQGEDQRYRYTAEGFPVAPPNQENPSDHQQGKAVDILQANPGMMNRDAVIKAMREAGLSAKIANDPIHFTARYGRMTSGPLSGYRATLHGNEVVIPLSNGTTIPLDMTPLIRNMDQNAQILAAQIERLDDLITLSRDSLNVNRKMLSYRS